jgi:cupin fold WbuC family metalloprotein
MEMIINQNLLDSLSASAKASPRLRMNLDLRNSPEDQSQRMLNAIEPGSPFPIHRHMKSSETVVCLRGHLREVYYNDAGEVTDVIDLAHGSDCVAVNIPLGQWHSVEVLDSGTVILECKDGAYDPLGPEDILEVGLIRRLKTFLENEARSCSMDPACVTPEYVCRMLGGTMAPEDIAESLEKAKELLR